MTCKKGITGEIREVRRSGGELHMDWWMPEFLSSSFMYSAEYFDSPRFRFSDARWYLRLLPCIGDGLDYVSLTLQRDDDDDDRGPSARTVICCWGVKRFDGAIEWRRIGEEELEFEKYDYCCLGEILDGESRSPDEDEEDEELVEVGEPVTIACVMKVPGTTARGVSSLPSTQEAPADGSQSSDKRDAATETTDCNLEVFTGEKQASEKRDAATQTTDCNLEVFTGEKHASEKRGIETLVEDFGKLLASGEGSGDVPFGEHRNVSPESVRRKRMKYSFSASGPGS